MTEPGNEQEPSPPPASRPPASRPARRSEEPPVLPDVSREDTDAGWGDGPGERDDDWYRRERPPHHE